MEIQPRLLWAVTALVLLAGSSLEDSVTQRQEDASGVHRGAVTLDCTYQTEESYYNLYWYKQRPGGSLAFLLWQYSGGSKESEAGPRFTVDFQKLQRSFNLSISDLQLNDSATYFCAFSRGFVIRPMGGYVGDKLIFGSGTRLQVEPKSDPTPPSVLLMKSKATSGKQVKAACLAKDFYPKEVKMNFVNSSVVYEQDDPVLSQNGKYNTIKVVQINDTEDVACSVDHQGKQYSAKAAKPAAEQPMTMPTTFCAPSNSTAAEENPEKVNMLAMTVLGLRVLFAKTIAFNTLMTIKLFVF